MNIFERLFIMKIFSEILKFPLMVYSLNAKLIISPPNEYNETQIVQGCLKK